MDKEDVYMNKMEYYSAIKKEEYNTICSNMEIIILNEVHQKEKHKCCVISLICGIKKKETKKFIYKTKIDLQT